MKYIYLLTCLFFCSLPALHRPEIQAAFQLGVFDAFDISFVTAIIPTLNFNEKTALSRAFEDCIARCKDVAMKGELQELLQLLRSNR